VTERLLEEEFGGARVSSIAMYLVDVMENMPPFFFVFSFRGLAAL
jgi:hypothetical protein